LSATRSISPTGVLALRDDAVAFEAEQKRGKGLGKPPSSIGPDPRLPHGSVGLALERKPKLVDAAARDLQHLGDAPHRVAEAFQVQRLLELLDDLLVADASLVL
jgi:hypothetical protein